MQREEKNVEKSIREAAKRNDMGSAKVCLFLIVLFCVNTPLCLFTCSMIIENLREAYICNAVCRNNSVSTDALLLS